MILTASLKRLAVFLCRNLYKIVEIRRKMDYNITDEFSHTMW